MAHTSDTALFPSGFERRIDTLMAPLVARGDASGVILIHHADQTRFADAYGFANREHDAPNHLNTRFLIGSIGKQFTAAAVLALQDSGRLHIDDRLDQHVPGFPNGDRITLRHLLAHTAGISRDLPDIERNTRTSHTLEEIADLIKRASLVSEPGERTNYSNNGYRILARVIEIVSGEDFGAFVKTRILERAGMRDSGVFRDQDSVKRLATGYCPWFGPDGVGPAPYCASSNGLGPGGIYTTAADLVSWSHALDTDAVLPAAARAEMLAPASDGRGLGVGLYRRFGRRCIGHDGVHFGYTASFEKYPDDDLTLVYLGNIETGSLGYIRAALPAIVFGQSYTEPPITPPPTPLAADRLAYYTGAYEVFPGLVLTVKRMVDGLVLGAGESDFPLDPIGPDAFYYRLKYATVTFDRDASGAVSALLWAEGGNTFRCRRLALE